jgi:hypothetical protein
MALSGTITKTINSYFYLKITWSATQSTSTNKSTVTAKLYFGGSGYTSAGSVQKEVSITIDGTKYTSTSAVTKSRGQELLLMTASKAISHNADGTKSFSMSGYAALQLTLSGTYYGTVSLDSTTFTLNTIPRASTPTLSASTTAMNSSVTIYTNRASSSFTHTLRYAYGSASGTIATGVGTSYAWTIPLSLANQIPNNVSGSGYIYCDTYSGSTKIGTKSVKFTATVPSSVKPTFTTVTHSEYVSNVNTVVGKYVQGLSRLSLAITGAAGAYSSTIKSYAITFNGATTNTKTQTSGIIKSSGNLTITGKVTDSRGRTASKNVTVNVLPYTAPKITGFSLQRCNADGTPDVMGEYVKVTRTGSVSSLVNGTEKNTLTYRIKSKARSDSTWTTKKEQTISGISLTGNDIIGGCLATTSYDFRLEITDKFKTSVAINTLPTAEVPMSWSKTGVGVGKIWEQGALDVGGDVYINNALAGYIVESGSNSNGDYAKFSNGTMICTLSKVVTNIATTISTIQGLTIYRSGEHLVWTFPAKFTTLPSVSMTAGLAKGDSVVMVFTQRHFSMSTSYASMQALALQDFDKTNPCNYIAIGKWK